MTLVALVLLKVNAYTFWGGQIDPFPPYDCYVLPLVDPCDIAHARDLVEYGLGVGKALVYAAIDYWDVNDGINVNRNYLEQGASAWSWYVTDLIEFTDATIEILDGTPTGVENDLDQWDGNDRREDWFLELYRGCRDWY